MSFRSWYYIDHSYKLGHAAIFEIEPTRVLECKIESVDGFRFVLKDGTSLYIEKKSTYYDFETAFKELQKISEALMLYLKEKTDILDPIEDIKSIK